MGSRRDHPINPWNEREVPRYEEFDGSRGWGGLSQHRAIPSRGNRASPPLQPDVWMKRWDDGVERESPIPPFAEKRSRGCDRSRTWYTRDHVSPPSAPPHFNRAVHSRPEPWESQRGSKGPASEESGRYSKGLTSRGETIPPFSHQRDYDRGSKWHARDDPSPAPPNFDRGIHPRPRPWEFQQASKRPAQEERALLSEAAHPRGCAFSVQHASSSLRDDPPPPKRVPPPAPIRGARTIRSVFSGDHGSESGKQKSPNAHPRHLQGNSQALRSRDSIPSPPSETSFRHCGRAFDYREGRDIRGQDSPDFTAPLNGGRLQDQAHFLSSRSGTPFTPFGSRKIRSRNDKPQATVDLGDPTASLGDSQSPDVMVLDELQWGRPNVSRKLADDIPSPKQLPNRDFGRTRRRDEPVSQQDSFGRSVTSADETIVSNVQPGNLGGHNETIHVRNIIPSPPHAPAFHLSSRNNHPRDELAQSLTHAITEQTSGGDLMSSEDKLQHVKGYALPHSPFSRLEAPPPPTISQQHDGGQPYAPGSPLTNLSEERASKAERMSISPTYECVGAPNVEWPSDIGYGQALALLWKDEDFTQVHVSPTEVEENVAYKLINEPYDPSATIGAHHRSSYLLMKNEILTSGNKYVENMIHTAGRIWSSIFNVELPLIRVPQTPSEFVYFKMQSYDDKVKVLKICQDDVLQEKTQFMGRPTFVKDACVAPLPLVVCQPGTQEEALDALLPMRNIPYTDQISARSDLIKKMLKDVVLKARKTLNCLPDSDEGTAHCFYDNPDLKDLVRMGKLAGYSRFNTIDLGYYHGEPAPGVRVYYGPDDAPKAFLLPLKDCSHISPAIIKTANELFRFLKKRGFAIFDPWNCQGNLVRFRVMMNSFGRMIVTVELTLDDEFIESFEPVVYHQSSFKALGRARLIYPQVEALSKIPGYEFTIENSLEEVPPPRTLVENGGLEQLKRIRPALQEFHKKYSEQLRVSGIYVTWYYVNERPVVWDRNSKIWHHVCGSDFIDEVIMDVTLSMYPNISCPHFPQIQAFPKILQEIVEITRADKSSKVIVLSEYFFLAEFFGLKCSRMIFMKTEVTAKERTYLEQMLPPGAVKFLSPLSKKRKIEDLEPGGDVVIIWGGVINEEVLRSVAFANYRRVIFVRDGLKRVKQDKIETFVALHQISKCLFPYMALAGAIAIDVEPHGYTMPAIISVFTRAPSAPKVPSLISHASTPSASNVPTEHFVPPVMRDQHQSSTIADLESEPVPLGNVEQLRDYGLQQEGLQANIQVCDRGLSLGNIGMESECGLPLENSKGNHELLAHPGGVSVNITKVDRKRGHSVWEPHDPPFGHGESNSDFGFGSQANCKIPIRGYENGLRPRDSPSGNSRRISVHTPSYDDSWREPVNSPRNSLRKTGGSHAVGSKGSRKIPVWDHDIGTQPHEPLDNSGRSSEFRFQPEGPPAKRARVALDRDLQRQSGSPTMSAWDHERQAEDMPFRNTEDSYRSPPSRDRERRFEPRDSPRYNARKRGLASPPRRKASAFEFKSKSPPPRGWPRREKESSPTSPCLRPGRSNSGGGPERQPGTPGVNKRPRRYETAIGDADVKSIAEYILRKGGPARIHVMPIDERVAGWKLLVDLKKCLKDLKEHEGECNLPKWYCDFLTDFGYPNPYQKVRREEPQPLEPPAQQPAPQKKSLLQMRSPLEALECSWEPLCDNRESSQPLRTKGERPKSLNDLSTSDPQVHIACRYIVEHGGPDFIEKFVLPDRSVSGEVNVHLFTLQRCMRRHRSRDGTPVLSRFPKWFKQFLTEHGFSIAKWINSKPTDEESEERPEPWQEHPRYRPEVQTLVSYIMENGGPEKVDTMTIPDSMEDKCRTMLRVLQQIITNSRNRSRNQLVLPHWFAQFLVDYGLPAPSISKVDEIDAADGRRAASEDYLKDPRQLKEYIFQNGGHLKIEVIPVNTAVPGWKLLFGLQITMREMKRRSITFFKGGVRVHPPWYHSYLAEYEPDHCIRGVDIVPPVKEGSSQKSHEQPEPFLEPALPLESNKLGPPKMGSEKGKKLAWNYFDLVNYILENGGPDNIDKMPFATSSLSAVCKGKLNDLRQHLETLKKGHAVTLPEWYTQFLNEYGFPVPAKAVAANEGQRVKYVDLTDLKKYIFENGGHSKIDVMAVDQSIVNHKWLRKLRISLRGQNNRGGITYYPDWYWDYLAEYEPDVKLPGHVTRKDAEPPGKRVDLTAEAESEENTEGQDESDAKREKPWRSPSRIGPAKGTIPNPPGTSQPKPAVYRKLCSFIMSNGGPTKVEKMPLPPVGYLGRSFFQKLQKTLAKQRQGDPLFMWLPIWYKKFLLEYGFNAEELYPNLSKEQLAIPPGMLSDSQGNPSDLTEDHPNHSFSKQVLGGNSSGVGRSPEEILTDPKVQSAMKYIDDNGGPECIETMTLPTKDSEVLGWQLVCRIHSCYFNQKTFNEKISMLPVWYILYLMQRGDPVPSKQYVDKFGRSHLSVNSLGEPLETLDPPPFDFSTFDSDTYRKTVPLALAEYIQQKGGHAQIENIPIDSSVPGFRLLAKLQKNIILQNKSKYGYAWRYPHWYREYLAQYEPNVTTPFPPQREGHHDVGRVQGSISTTPELENPQTCAEHSEPTKETSLVKGSGHRRKTVKLADSEPQWKTMMLNLPSCKVVLEDIGLKGHLGCTTVKFEEFKCEPQTAPLESGAVETTTGPSDPEHLSDTESVAQAETSARARSLEQSMKAAVSVDNNNKKKKKTAIYVGPKSSKPAGSEESTSVSAESGRQEISEPTDAISEPNSVEPVVCTEESAPPTAETEKKSSAAAETVAQVKATVSVNSMPKQKTSGPAESGEKTSVTAETGPQKKTSTSSKSTREPKTSGAAKSEPQEKTLAKTRKKATEWADSKSKPNALGKSEEMEKPNLSTILRVIRLPRIVIPRCKKESTRFRTSSLTESIEPELKRRSKPVKDLNS